MVCAGSPREKVVDAFQLLAAKTISLDEGFVFVVYLPNVVAKRSQRTLSVGISLTTHPSLLFLIGLLFIHQKSLSEITYLFHMVVVSLLYCSSMRLNGWQKLRFVEMERMILYRKNVRGTVWSLHCCRICWLQRFCSRWKDFSVSRLLT